MQRLDWFRFLFCFLLVDYLYKHKPRSLWFILAPTCNVFHSCYWTVVSTLILQPLVATFNLSVVCNDSIKWISTPYSPCFVLCTRVDALYCTKTLICGCFTAEWHATHLHRCMRYLHGFFALQSLETSQEVIQNWKAFKSLF